MDKAHKAKIFSAMDRLFKGYPGSSNTDGETVKEYCRQFARYPASYLDRIVDDFLNSRAGTERNTEFVPSVETIAKHIRSVLLTDQEQAEYRMLNNLTPAIEHHAPEPEPRRYEPPRNRSTRAEVVARFEANPGMRVRVLASTPIGRRIERLRYENRDCEILAEGVSLEKFRSEKWGEGARYVPLLETIYAR